MTPQSLCSSLIKNMQLLINYNSLITIHRHEYTKEKSSTNMIRHLKVSPIDWFKEMSSTCFSTMHMHNLLLWNPDKRAHYYITTCFNQSQANPSPFVMPVSFCCLTWNYFHKQFPIDGNISISEKYILHSTLTLFKEVL